MYMGEFIKRLANHMNFINLRSHTIAFVYGKESEDKSEAYIT